jgi:hypothetical protein
MIIERLIAWCHHLSMIMKWSLNTHRHPWTQFHPPQSNPVSELLFLKISLVHSSTPTRCELILCSHCFSYHIIWNPRSRMHTLISIIPIPSYKCWKSTRSTEAPPGANLRPPSDLPATIISIAHFCLQPLDQVKTFITSCLPWWVADGWVRPHGGASEQRQPHRLLHVLLKRNPRERPNPQFPTRPPLLLTPVPPSSPARRRPSSLACRPPSSPARRTSFAPIFVAKHGWGEAAMEVGRGSRI